MTFRSKFDLKSLLAKKPDSSHEEEDRFAEYRDEIANAVLLDGESRDRFMALVKGLENKYQPAGIAEYFHIQRMAYARWWQMRLWHPDQPINIARRPDAASFRTIDPPFALSEDLLRLEKDMNRKFNTSLSNLLKERKIRSGN
jgi:hypothetical protein